MEAMKHRNSQLVLPAALSAGSFFGLVLIMFLSDPVQNVSYALLFFAILLLLLLGLGHFLMALKPGKTSPKSRSRIFIVSALVVIVLMFRSAGSLNLTDILVMLLLGGGLLFYSGRRPS
jgi:succinate dehydrogenase/fumarate reductase cytochrome b subunit